MNHFTSAIRSVKDYLLKGNRAQWCLFILFTLILFCKSILFHWDAFHNLLISSFLIHPVEFIAFYLSKLLVPLFISSFIFISKRYWWTIVVSVLVDVWCMTNIVYYKSYNMMVSVEDLFLVNNMNGYWSSVLTYIDWYFCFLIVMTVLWTLLICVIPSTKQRKYWHFICIIVGIIILSFVSNYMNYASWYDINKVKSLTDEEIEWEREAIKENKSWLYGNYEYAIPFYLVVRGVQCMGLIAQSDGSVEYVKTQSILTHFPRCFISYVSRPNRVGANTSLSDNDKATLQPLFDVSMKMSSKNINENLVIILVESLESWPLDGNIDGKTNAPFLQSFLKNDHVLYCDKIVSEALKGNSSDGQMTIMSGLLPLKDVATCVLYGENTYPNFTHYFKDSYIVNPSLHEWNQDTMTVRYEFVHSLEPLKTGMWNDKDVLDNISMLMSNINTSTCILGITTTMHSPFLTKGIERFASNTTSIPPVLNNYLTCLNFADSCIAECVNGILQNRKLANNTTIIITGDHTIFKPAMLSEFKDFAKSQNLSIVSGESFCPLIIYSPKIDHNIQIRNTCYQMDIYPTIMHLIGCDDYYWKGLGVNLLDSTARKNRQISEEEAYRLSDLLIRSNAFELYKQGKLFNYQKNDSTKQN